MNDKQFTDRLRLAVDLRRNGYFTEARSVALDLQSQRPNNAAVWHTLGQIYTEIGVFDAALAHNQRALGLIHEYGDLEHNAAEFQLIALGTSISLMRYGRFEEALPLWEAGRFQVSWAPWPGSTYFTGQEDPQETQGQTLLIQSEGGYGDTFMFLRWVPLLKARFGFSKVSLMVWSPLVDFCEWGAFGIDHVYSINKDNVRFDEYKYATSIMSLMSVFKLHRWEAIPRWNPPIAFPQWRGPRGKDFKLGFCWRAEENTSPIRTKSLPVEVAEQIASQVNAFSLSPQKADLYNSDAFAEPASLKIEPECIVDWRRTAQYMLSMDFILTVDTAVAHLAGLLGVPTMVLLPTSSCWRWGTPERRWDQYWYGTWEKRHMTYYRQKKPLSWNAQDIVKTLEAQIQL